MLSAARARALAEAVYQASATINHGARVAMAPAELGRCDEAAALARRMIARAGAEGNPEIFEKLKVELSGYESATVLPPDRLKLLRPGAGAIIRKANRTHYDCLKPPLL